MHYEAFTMYGAFWAFLTIFATAWLVLDLITFIKREIVQLAVITLVSFLLALIITNFMLIARMI